jgi:3-deoxy-D-arabino-heptulosonate 7-phosphate (DAHP) synthase class II
MLTFEEVVQEVRRLKPQEKRKLGQILMQETPKTIEQIVAEQGVGPLDFNELRKLAGGWPEDENIDDFTAFVKESRQGDSYRRIANLED